MVKHEFSTDKSQAGFTLVELAVVMIIIGLLIGGVLKGQELIANAQVTSTVAQVKGIDAAVTTFNDMYDGMPGDVLGTRLAGCATACAPAATAITGNGRVDDLFSSVPQAEGIAFWQQLAAADLITGINVNNGATFGGQYPDAEIGGGFHVAFIPGAIAGTPSIIGTVPPSAGHYLALHNAPAGAVAAAGADLTPNQAFRIDRKLDDGVPAAGTVRGMGAAACGTGGAAGAASVYNEAVPSIACGLYLRIQG